MLENAGLSGQPSLHGFYACVVCWVKEAPLEKLQPTFYVRPLFLVFGFFCVVETLLFGGEVHLFGICGLVGLDILVPILLVLRWRSLMVLDTEVDLLAVVEQRLIPAQVRSEWATLRWKGLATVWVPASHVGHAGVGVVSLRGALFSCPPSLLRSSSVLFDCGRAIRCMLLLECGRFLHLVVLYGHQGADREAEKLARTDQLLDAAFGELGVVAREQPCLVVGDFNVEPTKIPCRAKWISAGLWVGLEAAWSCASGRLFGVTCNRTWDSAGGSRRDFMIGCPRAAAAVTGCMIREDRLILLHLAIRTHFQCSRWVSRVSKPVQRAPLWPASWLPVLDKDRGSSCKL